LALAFWVRDIYRKSSFINLWATMTPPDILLCNSQWTRRSLTSLFHGITPVIIYNPVAAPQINRERARAGIRSELNAASDALAIVLTSRLERWKGHELLLDALALLSDIPDWVLWVAGGVKGHRESLFLNNLHRRCARLGIVKRVRWLGHRNDVAEVLAAADIHCQPNLKPEPFGNAFVEALHAGLPVVTIAFGGPTEILAPGCGRLIPPGDPVALASTLRDYLLSPDLRRQAAEAGPRRAAELCDPERQMGHLQRSLRAIVNARA
jgi:glycosyltransferase involved in cell wall biosynthesis